MAKTTFTLTHARKSDYRGTASMTAQQVTTHFGNLLNGAKGGAYGATSVAVEGQASGTVTLSGVAGVAASGTVTLSSAAGVAATATVTLAGSADDVTVTVNGFSIAAVPAGANDTATALLVRDALNADTDIAALITATASGTVVTLTADAKGTAGNAITLDADALSAGTATPSGGTLTGGLQAVTVTVGGTAVSVATEGANDTATAVLVRDALNANGTVAALINATASGAVITLTADTKGTAGNSITLVSAAGSGSATRSGATLSGGLQAATVVVDGNSVSIGQEGSDDTATAVLLAAALNADNTVNDLVSATSSGAVVTLTAVDTGADGDALTLTSSAAVGTATASGATLSGGAAISYTF